MEGDEPTTQAAELTIIEGVPGQDFQLAPDHIEFPAADYEFLLDLEPGHLLVGTEGSGFFRKVSRVGEEADVVRVDTVDPTLADIARAEEIDASLSLGRGEGGGDSEDLIGLVGVKIARTKILATGNIDVDMSSDLRSEFDFDLSGEVATNILAVVKGKISGELAMHVDARGSVSASQSLEVWTHRFTPFTFFIGPLPVVIVPKLTLSLSVAVSTSGAVVFDSSLRATGDATISVEWLQGESLPTATATAGFDLTGEGGLPVENGQAVTGLAKVTATLIPAVRFDFYDFIGPEFSVRPYVEVGTNGHFAGVEARASLSTPLPVLKHLGANAELRYSKNLVRVQLP